MNLTSEQIQAIADQEDGIVVTAKARPAIKVVGSDGLVKTYRTRGISAADAHRLAGRVEAIQGQFAAGAIPAPNLWIEMASIYLEPADAKRLVEEQACDTVLDVLNAVVARLPKPEAAASA